MRQDSFISKMDDLQAWFELNNAGKEPMPYFTLYRGFQAKPDATIYRNTEIGDQEKAWETLEDVIQAHSDGGGSFRVYITSKPGFNVGFTTLLKLPSPQGAQVAGIAGAQSGMFGIYGSAQEMIQAEIDRRMEVYELKRELEDMKAGNAAMSGIAQFKELMEYPAFNNLVQMLGMKVMGLGPHAQPAQHPQTIPGTAAPADGIQGVEPEGFDYDVIEPALDKMRRVFPNVEMTLDKLADWIDKNPDQAKMIFGNLQQPGT